MVREGAIRAGGRAAAVAAACAALAGCGSTPTATLDGRLVDAAGPVGRTSLTLVPAEGDGEEHEAVTRPNGLFTLPDVEHGTYELSVAYAIEDVFECAVRYPVEIDGETEEQVRRFTVPAVKVAPDGSARVGRSQKTTCRTLKHPLTALACKGRFPLAAYALPPRDGLSGPGYRKIRTVRFRQCDGIRVLGRLPGTKAAEGWLFAALPGKGPKTAWFELVVVGRSPQRHAWSAVADSAARDLPERAPSLPGGRLPDLALTKPVQSAQLGDPCSFKGEVVHWRFGIRNVGRGLAPPTRLEVHMRNFGISDTRTLGAGRWIRGLAPGESVSIDDYRAVTGKRYIVPGSYTEVTIDPKNAIAESNESNNSTTLGALPNLICG